MSISDYERKKLLEKAAKLKAEKESTGQPTESLSQQQSQDQRIDQRLEQAQAAAKVTAQATGKFAKDLAAKTAKIAQEQAQRAKAKADAWKQEQEAKRAEEAEKKMPLSTVEPKTRAVEDKDQDGKSPGRKRTLVALIGALFLIGAGVVGYLAIRTRDAAPPTAEPVAQFNQVETSTPQEPEPEREISEPVIEPAPQPVPEPQVEPTPPPVVIEVQPKAQEAPKAVQEVERTSKPAEKKSRTLKSHELAKPEKKDWQDKASSDLDKFAEQFK